MQPDSQLRLCTAKPWANPNLLLETFLWRKSWECLTVQWPQELLWNNTAQKTTASRAGESIVSACLMPLQCFPLFRSYTGLFGKVEIVVRHAFFLKGFPTPQRKVKCTHSSTAWLKLFLIVHLWRGKQTAIDIVSTPLFPSEGALRFKAHAALCAPCYFGFSMNVPILLWVEASTQLMGRRSFWGLLCVWMWGHFCHCVRHLEVGLSYQKLEGRGFAWAEACSEGLVAASLLKQCGERCAQGKASVNAYLCCLQRSAAI